MSYNGIAVVLLGCLTLCGCSSHLIFMEEDHVGLKAQFEPNNPSPAQVSLGYRRGVVAVVPQQSAGTAKMSNLVTVTTTRTPTNTVVTVQHDPNELMSLYTVFRANVGFGDPVEIHHFMATGAAAASLLANENDLRDVTRNLNVPNSSKGGNP